MNGAYKVFTGKHPTDFKFLLSLNRSKIARSLYNRLPTAGSAPPPTPTHRAPYRRLGMEAKSRQMANQARIPTRNSLLTKGGICNLFKKFKSSKDGAVCCLPGRGASRTQIPPVSTTPSVARCGKVRGGLGEDRSLTSNLRPRSFAQRRRSSEASL